MVLDESGRLGLGTLFPSSRLHVGGNAHVEGQMFVGNTVTGQTIFVSASANLAALNPGTTTAGGPFRGPAQGHMVFDLRNNDVDDAIAWRYSAANNSSVDTIGFVMKGNGRVGFATNTPLATAHVSGSLMVAGNDNQPCEAGMEGLIRRNPTNGRMEVCE